MVQNTPYTYLIGWSNQNKWYYGVRYSKDCNPADLWKTYFTSSKHVKSFREEYGEPDVVQIRRTFSDWESALEWEQGVLRKIKIKKNDNWLNIAIGKPSFSGKKHTEETKNKMRKSKPDGFSEKISKLHSGRKRSDETRQKISDSKKGFTYRSKTWIFHLDGQPIEIYNLSKYCKENNLNVSCMRDVYRGHQKQHKNYKKEIQ